MDEFPPRSESEGPAPLGASPNARFVIFSYNPVRPLSAMLPLQHRHLQKHQQLAAPLSTADRPVDLPSAFSLACDAVAPASSEATDHLGAPPTESPPSTQPGSVHELFDSSQTASEDFLLDLYLTSLNPSEPEQFVKLALIKGFIVGEIERGLTVGQSVIKSLPQDDDPGPGGLPYSATLYYRLIRSVNAPTESGSLLRALTDRGFVCQGHIICFFSETTSPTELEPFRKSLDEYSDLLVQLLIMSQQEEAKLDPTAIEQGKFFWPGSSESHADCLDGHSIRQGGSNGNSGEGASSRVTLSPLMARILSMQPGGALGDGLLSTVDLVAQHSDLLAEASAPTMARYYRGLPAGSLVRPPPCRNHRIEHVRQLAGLWFDICIDPIRRVICQAHMSATLSALLYAGFSGRPIVIRAMAAGEGVTSKDGHRNLSLAQLAREAAEESLFQDILSFYQILDSSFVFDETSDFTPNSRRPNCAARARNYCTFERLPRSPAPAPPPPEKPSGIPAPLAGTDPGPSLGLAGGESMEPTGVGSSHEAGVPEDALPVLPGPMPTPGGPRDGASLLSQSLHRQALEAASLGGLGAGDPAAALPEAETQADPATCWETHARPQPLIAPLTIAPGPVVFHIHWPAPGPAASDLAGRAGGQLPISLAGQPMFLVAAESQWLAGSKHPVWKDCHVLAKKLRAFVRLFSEKTSRSYFSPPAASSSTGPYSSSTGSGHASHAFSIHPSIALEGLLSESRGKVSLFAYRYIGELHALADGDWAQMRLFVDRLAAEAKTSPYSALALETLGQFLALHIESTPEPGTWDTARRDDCPPMTAAISRDPTQYVSWIVRQWLGLDEECDTIYLRDLEAASQELLQWAQAKSVPDVESDAVASAERISDLIFGLGL